MENLLIKPLKIVYIFFKHWANTTLWFIKILYSCSFKNYVERRNDKQLLTILANGPSLTEALDSVDYSVGDFAVVNDFYKSPYYRIIKPQYLFLIDPLNFRNNYEISKFVETVDWSMKLFVPYKVWKTNSYLQNMPNEVVEVIPINTITYSGFKCLKNWIFYNGLAMPRAQNVLVATIFVGINMGYKDIKLYGVDHSWTESIRVSVNNEVCMMDSHFYETEEVKLLPFHKSSGEQYKMHEILRDLAQTFDSYHQLREYADYNGCRIVNCTRCSYIDAFEREQLM